MRLDYTVSLRLCLLLSAVVLLQSVPGSARPGWITRSFKVEDGLAHQVVRDVVRAPNGDFWVATWGGGISRYDGSKWETLNDERVLSDFMIRCLAFDQNGGLWAGTPEGIRYFDGSRWQLFTTANTPELQQDSAFAILARQNGEVWFGLAEGYLYAYDPRRSGASPWSLVAGPELFDHGTIRSLLELDDGSIWVGGEHIYHFQDSRWTRYPLNQVVFSLCRSQDGEFYAAATNGLYRFAGGGWKRVPEGGSAPRSLGIAADGSLLVGTESGLRIRQDDTWDDFVFDFEEPVVYVEVIRSFPDSSTWIGTRGGAYVIQKSNWTPVPWPAGDVPLVQGRFYAAPGVVPIAVQPDGRLFRWRDGSWKPEAHLGKAGGAVVGILGLRQGKLLVRRELAVVEYDLSSLAARAVVQVPHPEVWSSTTISGDRTWDPVAFTGDGTCWWNRGVDNVLYRRLGGEWVRDHGGFEPGAPIQAIKVTQDGRLWVISNNRAAVDGRHVPEFDVMASPAHRGHRITDILTARDGSVWISTSGSGIFVFDGRHVRKWTTRNGLPSNWVRCLFEATDGALWAGMADSTIASYKAGRWVSFTRKDFQLNGSVAQMGETPDGSLWFLLEPGGLLSYAPSAGAPETVIDLHPESVIPGGNALFAFHGWDIAHVTPAEELVYSWRIVEAESGTEVVPWSPYRPETTVASPALKPGTYQFEVRSADKERNQDATPAVREFTVESYLYARPAFWLTVVPSLALIVFLSVRWREARRNLLHMARIDGLTGVYKRDYFTHVFEAEIQRARRYGRELSVMLLDLDHFKNVNDSYGHDAGDRMLRQVALNIAGACRASDLVCRWGGEEFLLVLPETGLKEALVVAERIRKMVSEASVATERGSVACTVSIGLACLSERTGNLDDLVKLADRALYRAKRRGRNRVQAAVEE